MPFSHCRLIIITTVYFCPLTLILKVCPHTYLITPILSSNSATTSFVFFKSSSFSQLSCFTVNSFHYTKYFTTSLTFLLFKIFSTFYSSTSIGFTFSFFWSSICSLYYTTWLMFTTGWILIEVGSCNLTTLVVKVKSSGLYLFSFWFMFHFSIFRT